MHTCMRVFFHASTTTFQLENLITVVLHIALQIVSTTSTAYVS